MEPSQTLPWTKESTYQTIRQFLGYTGIAFPFVLFAGSNVLSDCYWIQKSISAYYHTIMGPFFVGFLWAFAMFLFLYRGENNQDRFASRFAALCAIILTLSPCMVDPDQPGCQVQPFAFLSHKAFHVTHIIFAAGFFITQTYLTFFLFTKTKDTQDHPMTMRVIPNFFGMYDKKEKANIEKLKMIQKEKNSRNNVYVSCGRVMLVCTVGIIVYELGLKNKFPQMADYCPTFFLETIALFAFGIAWLVKSEKHSILWKDSQKVL